MLRIVLSNCQPYPCSFSTLQIIVTSNNTKFFRTRLSARFLLSTNNSTKKHKKIHNNYIELSAPRDIQNPIRKHNKMNETWSMQTKRTKKTNTKLIDINTKRNTFTRSLSLNRLQPSDTCAPTITRCKRNGDYRRQHNYCTISISIWIHIILVHIVYIYIHEWNLV